MGKGLLLLIIFLVPVVMSSGCISIDPSTIAMANPLIQGFLEEHPNADIRATHYSASESENILEEIRSDCDNEYIGPKELYRVNITDPDTHFYAIVWIDWETKTIECAWKLGTSGVEVSKPKEDQGCEHHTTSMCKSGHIYWFDSCGNKEDKKIYCERSCVDGEPECSEGKWCQSKYREKCYNGHVYWYDSCDNRGDKKMYCEFGCEVDHCTPEEQRSGDNNETHDCELHSYFRCDGNHVYWFDSCGNKESKKEYCPYGCDKSKCITPDDAKCMDSDGGYNIYEKGTATYGSTSLSDHCNSDGTLTEKYCYSDTEIKWNTTSCGDAYVCEEGACIPYNQSECNPHQTYACYNNHVYWFDSCGTKEEIKEECTYGCENNECVEQNCTTHAEYACNENEGMIYWYDSCGYMEEVRDQCYGYGCTQPDMCISACNDTEEMGDYYVQGTVTDGLGQEWEDYCYDNTTLIEYTCGIDQMKQVYEYACEAGCVEGACTGQ